MADLPDLDTSKVGIAAFFNALDNGADSVDPADVLSDSSIDSYDAFDNGVKGKLTHSYRQKTRQFNFRVKTDGWVVVWIDRTNDPANNTGYIDILHDWTDWTAKSANLPETTLTHEIKSLVGELANSGNINFSHGSCGLYCYEYEGATTFDVIHEHRTNAGDMSGSVSYRSGVTRDYHAAAGAVQTTSGTHGDSSVGFEATQIARSVDTTPATGFIDVISNSLAPNSGTFFSNQGSDAGYTDAAVVEHLIIYSE